MVTNVYYIPEQDYILSITPMDNYVILEDDIGTYELGRVSLQGFIYLGDL